MLYTTVGSNGERANDFQSTCARPLASGDRPQSPPPDHTGAHSCCYFSLATKRRTGVQVVGMDRASREQLIET